jgi:hypothetical protein
VKKISEIFVQGQKRDTGRYKRNIEGREKNLDLTHLKDLNIYWPWAQFNGGAIKEWR